MSHVKLFTSNSDHHSKLAREFCFNNRITLTEYEWHNEEDLKVFNECKITQIPTLIYGSYRFEGIRQIEASQL